MEKDGKEEGRKKTNQKIRVGGLIGVGGVLVIGGLLMVANFAIKRRRNKTRDSNKNPTSTDPKATQETNNNGTCVRKKNEDQDQRGQRLHFLLQTSSPMTLNSSSCKGHVNKNGDGISTMSLISQEQKLAAEIDDLRVSESVLPDAQEQEIIKLRDDFDALKDRMVLPDSHEQEINKSSDDLDALKDEMYGTEKPILKETTEEVENNKETSAIDHDSEMCSIEDKKEVEDEYSIEIGNAGSDDTRDSSLKSNTDDIWPVEMTEETRPELKEAGQSDGCREEDNFAIKRRRNKTRDSNKNLTSANSKASQEANNNGTCVKKKNEDQDQESQGLHFLLQTSSPLMTLSSSSCEGHVDRDGDGSSTTRVVSQEEKLTTEIDGLRVSEIVLSDAQEQEIIKLRDDFDALKDGMVLLDSQGQKINKSTDDFDALEDEMYGIEKPIPIETIKEVENNKETSVINHHDSEMSSVEDKKEVKENFEEKEIAGSGSDDIGYSSLESNTNDIWPAEMTEETMPELEEVRQSDRCREEDKEMQTKKHTQLNNDATIANTTVDKQISTLSAWILSMLVLVLFFLWIYPVPRKVLSAVLSAVLSLFS